MVFKNVKISENELVQATAEFPIQGVILRGIQP